MRSFLFVLLFMWVTAVGLAAHSQSEGEVSFKLRLLQFNGVKLVAHSQSEGEVSSGTEAPVISHEDISKRKKALEKALIIVFAEDLKRVQNHETLLDSVMSKLRKCYHEEEWFATLKSWFIKSCGSVLKSGMDIGLSYFVLKEAIMIEPDLDTGASLKLLDKIYGRSAVNTVEEKDQMMLILIQELQKCDIETEEALLNSLSCRALIKTAKEEQNLSYERVQYAIRYSINNLSSLH